MALSYKISLILGLLFLVTINAQAPPPRKSLAGPPSEFSLHEIPSPIPQGQTSTSVRFAITAATLEDGSVGWSQSLPVDSLDGFVFSIFDPTGFTVSLLDPTGTEVPNLSQYLSDQTGYVIGDDAYYSVPVTTYVLPNFAAGVYTLKLSSSSLSDKVKAKVLTAKADGYVYLATPTPVESLAYLNSYSLLQDNQVSITAQLYDNSAYGRFNGTIPAALSQFVQDADLLVEFPDGREESVSMHDDGVFPDAVAGDGVFGAAFKATQAGNYVLSTLLSGIDGAGNAFMRSTEHLIPVVTPSYELTGEATATTNAAGDILEISVGVNVNADNTVTTVRGYAEILGTQGSNLVEIAWIGGMVDIVTNANGESAVVLSLDLQWVALAGAQEPFILQNVYLADVATDVPVTTVAQIKVDSSSVKNLGDILPEKPKEITKQMRQGKLPERYANALKNRNPKDADVVEIVFVHGYCSKQNPWQVSGSFPSDEAYFLNPGASLDNDAFALKIAEFADPLYSYSLVGHSQGGMASLHLLNYYFTGVDINTAPYSVQTMGTPFLGNSGAGGAADLIQVFGVGCGANPSLTKDGAALWLSGITSDARQEVFYYTTQYESGLFKFCQWGVGLVLSAPNDGTAELSLAQLPGANNLGNTQGQCHTENMNFPPQCYDDSRNVKIYDNATPEDSLKKKNFLRAKQQQH